MRAGVFLILILAIVGCTRGADKSKSFIRIQLDSGPGTLASIPPGHKACYGVNVTGPGIAATPRTCGAPLGAHGGFAEGGGVLEVSVPKGTDRTVTLLAFVTSNTSAPCPTLSPVCVSSRNCNTYKMASAPGVSTLNDVTELYMTADFPGLGVTEVVQDAPSSALCTATVTAALTSGGTVVDPAMSPAAGAPDSQAHFTLYRRTSGSAVEAITRSGQSTENLSIALRPQIKAVSAKDGVLYGMLHDGSMVLVTGSGDYAAMGACPFTTCQLPVWFKSFSFGAGTGVYGLDHGGGIWRMDDASTAVALSSVPAFVAQVQLQTE